LFTAFERKHPFLAYRMPALGYAVLIFVVSALPGYEFPELPFYSFDKLVHALEFGLFGILMYRAFRYRSSFSRPYLLTLCVGIPFAALDEVHQYFVPGRNCDPVDFIMDFLGLVIFTGISAWLHRGEK
jgi:VanZ family protein